MPSTSVDNGITFWDPDGAAPLPACVTIGSFSNGNEPCAYWDGRTWQPIQMGYHGSIWTMCTLGSDLIAAGSMGLYSTAAGTVNATIARWDGTRWWALGTGAPTSSIACVCELNGSIYTASGLASGGLHRWDGSAWTTLPDPTSIGVQIPRTVGVYNGQLVAAGANGGPIAAWDGAAWSVLVPVNVPVPAGTIASWNGQLIIGSTAGTFAWNGVSWQSLSGLPVGGLAAHGSDLYAVGTSLSTKVVRWSGTPASWLPIGNALNNVVYVVASGGAGTYIGGVFTAGGGYPTLLGIAKYDAGQYTRLGNSPAGVHAIAVGSADVYAAAGTLAYQWDGSNWTSYPAFTDNVYALTLSGGAPIAGGAFTAGIRSWTGSVWQAVGGGISGGASTPTVYALLAQGGDLYAAGSFTTAGATPAANIARWDGAAWHNLATGLDASALAMTFFGSDLIVGGNFVNADGAPASHVARWDGQAWQPMGDGFNAAVTALAVHDGSLYAGGTFTASGANTIYRVARWDGQAWEPMTYGVPNGSVQTLGDTGSELLVGGNFQAAGGAQAAWLAHWGCPPPAPCYANCDTSTTPPVLNVADFTCFLQQFAAADPRANCDSSTAPPVLNVADFTCFLQKFAAGCP
jgi:hypothetical protein